MATSGSSASVGAINGARGAYEIHGSNNQENQAPRKNSSTNNNLRKRSTSNLRQPLSNVQTTRRSTTEQQRANNGGHNSTDRLGVNRSNREDLYKKKSNDSINQTEQYDDIPENMYRPDKEDAAGWIHREKLAKIENEELQAAGINLAKGRSRNRDTAGSRSRDIAKDQRDSASTAREEKRQRVSSPASENPVELPDQSDWDFRTPEELADEAAAAQVYSSPALRKSGSRIPVMASSPTPIPSDRYERETPMPRKRTLSGSITPDESFAASKSRVEQEMEADTVDSVPASPSKQRSRSTSNPRSGTTPEPKGAPGAKKTSVGKTPMPPNSYNNNRPPTRGNDSDRPRTATNAPEGDPPWLMTMYKPDPRLPPDQQLIPTLAKKQQQEMWEANGKIPSTYDRNFSPLVIYGADGMAQPQPQPQSQSHSQSQPQPQSQSPPQQQPQTHPHLQPTNSNATSQYSEPPNPWPLKPTTSPTKVIITNRPPTSSGTGGYSTMPKVAVPPPTLAPSPKIEPKSPASSRAHTPQLTQATSLQHTQSATGAPSRLKQQSLTDAQDEKVQKKGCCCIVM